ncbi:TPR Domain containing protein [Trichomonas vaginalis G3]|uniref:Outer dynein arm-docking complex subunit 4 n=1 Tax=Trichomonas vaginalis (strain ATCC PRA-98 / G3) TaxID=412133 RepID=A2DDD8_TRIV3|nr:cellular component assembly [Trichomonas vaginalis G3]EAY21617.1 TPR Domain containing protein [Trichomonas vaginalis G3]KAI5489707.1 cellular component assembly [Trichomonas vaginalis G3]|eukprot:XP_001582603.1 TPR Domain containing protein [Trichomonas vaginalis G3]
MVSVLKKEQITTTFKYRMGLLGKSAYVGDGDEPPEVCLPPKPGEKPLTEEDKKELEKKKRRYPKEMQEYKALFSEGTSLYRRNEYTRAIEAFTKASEQQVDHPDLDILVDRADCYIQIGKPEMALEDVNKVLSSEPQNARAILTKAEAYFSMGEFEFALVYFQRGLAIRKDMSGFRDGVTKAKHAILDSINGKEIFQPNPNYSSSRPRKALYESRELPKTEQEPQAESQQPEQPQKDISRLLPEQVAPLQSTNEKQNFLGELSLDYDFLTELQAELRDQAKKAESEKKDDGKNKQEEHGKKEDEEIQVIVNDALEYLNQRGAFWNQQRSKSASNEDKEKSRTIKGPTTSSLNKSPKAKKAGSKKSQTAHYEMSKLQQYESKYPSTSENQA